MSKQLQYAMLAFTGLDKKNYLGDKGLHSVALQHCTIADSKKGINADVRLPGLQIHKTFIPFNKVLSVHFHYEAGEAGVLKWEQGDSIDTLIELVNAHE